MPLKQVEGKQPKYVEVDVKCAPKATVQITVGGGKSRSTCDKNSSVTVFYDYKDVGRSVTVKVPEKVRFWVLAVPLDTPEGYGS